MRLIICLAIAALVCQPLLADEHQYDEKELWGETNMQLDQDEPDQDPVYDEDDPVYDEADDYLEEDSEDE